MAGIRHYSKAFLVLAMTVGLLVVQWVPPDPAEAAFPGENGKIYFASDRTTGEGVDNPEGDSEIFAMNPNGTGLEQLTNNALDDYEPAVSADGLRVAFTRCEECLDAPGLFTMDADGTNQRQIVESEVINPAWSPDGRWIVYAVNDYEYGSFALAKVRPNGSGGEIILRINPRNSGFGPYSPAWSPDGKKIAYAGFTKNRQSDIFTINPDGSGKKNLTQDAAPEGEPNWSPGGTRIVYEKGTYLNSEIYKMNADGSRKTRLTDHPAPDSSPVFSPEGTKIAFVRGPRNGAADIFTMNADGTVEGRFTRDPASDESPDWQKRPIVP